MAKQKFLQECRHFRKAGYRFLGLRSEAEFVIYLFRYDQEIVSLEQKIEEQTVHSIAPIFPLADFPERQMYRDRRIKAIGNVNLVPKIKEK